MKNLIFISLILSIHFMIALPIMASEPKNAVASLLKKHELLTGEALKIEVEVDHTNSPPLFESFKKFASHTQKPTNASFIRISSDLKTFNAFLGLGLEEKLTEEVLEKIKVDYSDFKETDLERRKLFLATLFLEKLESPLDLRLIKNELTEKSSYSSFSFLKFIFILFFVIIVITACLIFFVRAYFSELFISAQLEKRISPYFGKFKKINYKEDLITGGGVSANFGE